MEDRHPRARPAGASGGVVMSMYDRIGGEPTIRKLAEEFHACAMRDPLLYPKFVRGRPAHLENLVTFLVEMFGGPARYSAEHGGTAGMLAAHRRLRVTEEQAQRFVELMLAAADVAGLPADEHFRTTFAQHLRNGAGFTVKFSQPDSPTPPQPFPPIQPWSW